MKTTNDRRFPTQTFGNDFCFMRASSAFTLIELLVVVLIIGILAAIAVPQYQKAVWKTRAAEMLVWAGNAKRVVETYILGNGGFPSNDEDLLQSGIASIDLVKNLTCEGEGGNRICYNKHYGYRIHCTSDRCTVIIEQMEDGNMATGTMEGTLEMRGTSSWVAEAGYINGSLAGRVNCEAFANAFNGVCEGIDAGGGEEGGGEGGDNTGDDNNNNDSNSESSVATSLAASISSFFEALAAYQAMMGGAPYDGNLSAFADTINYLAANDPQKAEDYGLSTEALSTFANMCATNDGHYCFNADQTYALAFNHGGPGTPYDVQIDPAWMMLGLEPSEDWVQGNLHSEDGGQTWEGDLHADSPNSFADCQALAAAFHARCSTPEGEYDYTIHD